MTLGNHAAFELTTQLAISRQAIDEAMSRGLLAFVSHRQVPCWLFGDSQNGSFRRLDGHPLRIRGQAVKAEATTQGKSWHQLIGLDDIVAGDRRDALLAPEGSKDALAAFHFAHAENRLSQVGVIAALGSAIKPLSKDVEKLFGRRVRIFSDVDRAGQEATARIGRAIASVAAEVQIFDLAGLHRSDGRPVKDLFDVTRIGYDDFEANRDLWSITSLDAKGPRVRIFAQNSEFSSALPLSPSVFPVCHEFLVYPVSNTFEFEKEIEKLAIRNACIERDTAREKSWQLARDVIAVQKRIARKLAPDELMKAFNRWYNVSKLYLDPKKTSDDYCAQFLAQIGKVRVPTGEGEALKTALARISTSPLPDIPERPDAPKSWRSIAALHRELARQSANGRYFLSCRDAAKAHGSLNKDSANTINHALAQLGAVEMRIGEHRPGGKASEFRWLLPL